MSRYMVSPTYRCSHGMTWCSHPALKHAPYGHHQSVCRQLHQSRMDSRPILPSRIASLTFGYFLGRHVRIGTVDNRHSRLQTCVRYSLPWRALSCIVALVSACLPWCCPLACFWCGFYVDCRGGGFCLSWLPRGMRLLWTAGDAANALLLTQMTL